MGRLAKSSLLERDSILNRVNEDVRISVFLVWSDGPVMT